LLPKDAGIRESISITIGSVPYDKSIDELRAPIVIAFVLVISTSLLGLADDIEIKSASELVRLVVFMVEGCARIEFVFRIVAEVDPFLLDAWISRLVFILNHST